MHAVRCDVSEVDAVRELFAKTLPALGIKSIDVLVNNAGVGSGVCDSSAAALQSRDLH